MHCFFGLGPSKWLISLGLLGFSNFIWALERLQQSAGVELMLNLNPEVLNLVQSCQGMYQRMELRVCAIFP